MAASAGQLTFTGHQPNPYTLIYDIDVSALAQDLCHMLIFSHACPEMLVTESLKVHHFYPLSPESGQFKEIRVPLEVPHNSSFSPPKIVYISFPLQYKERCREIARLYYRPLMQILM